MMIFANLVKAAEEQLKCVYDYPRSLQTSTNIGGKRDKLTNQGIEPDFCDTLTRRFVTDKLY